MGVPADEAVNLNATSSRLLQLEEKYLKPFLTRKLALGTNNSNNNEGCVASPVHGWIVCRSALPDHPS